MAEAPSVAAPPVLQGVLGKTNQHYDLDPRLFELFLDQRMKYSSAWFGRGAKDLDTAQTDKLQLIAENLQAAPGKRCLDIGCGWGSLALFLAHEYGCEVVAITPADAQAAVVRQRAVQMGVETLVTVRTGHFEELALSLQEQSYDAVSMVGSIVHFPDKPWALRETRRLLRRGARVYLSESCFRNAEARRRFESRPGTLFVRDDIFGWGELLPVSDYVRWFEDAGLSLSGLRDLTDDYHRTIEHWRSNVLERSHAIDKLEPGSAARLLRYFEASNAGWGHTTKHYAMTAVNAR